MTSQIGLIAAVVLGSAGITATLILLLRPLLQHYALVRPNARSTHRIPTPQGGGMAVISAVAIMFGIALALAPVVFPNPLSLVIVIACALALAIVGALDDIRPIEALPRLLLQTAAVLVVVGTLPAALRLVPVLPWWFERVLMVLAMLWLVNVVNFMDGIDWMTVAEIVPLTAALAAFGLMGALPVEATFIALALCGAMIGFAPFNKPVARLFLGDVGSLPIGLLLGWLLALLGEHHLAAALLLSLYYVADATITLVRRLARSEQVMQAHRGHFYQQAVDGTLGVYAIVGRVFLLNLVLIALAVTTLLVPLLEVHVAALAAGCLAVALVLAQFARAKP